MARPKMQVPLVTKIAQAFAAVERLQRLGNHPRGFNYTRAHDVFEVVRHKLLDRGVIICPVESLPTYVEIETNGGERMTECRLQVTYTFQDDKERLDPPLVINGLGRSIGEEALEIAQTKAQKSLLKRFGIMADEQDDAPTADGYDEHDVHDAPTQRTPRADDKTVTHAQRRAFAAACESTNKTGDEILHYLFSAHQVSNVGDLKRGKQFTEALRWAATPTGSPAPKPQAAPALQGNLPLPRPAPSFEMRVQGKTHVIEPKTGSYSV